MTIIRVIIFGLKYLFHVCDLYIIDKTEFNLIKIW